MSTKDYIIPQHNYSMQTVERNNYLGGLATSVEGYFGAKNLDF